MIYKHFIALLIGIAVYQLSIAQVNPEDDLIGRDGRVNIISTAVPIMMVAPDSRSGAMGDVGVATSPDVYSQHWNPAKYAFIEKDMGVSLSFTPWLKTLVGDMSLSYLTFYKRINPTQTLGASLKYFSLGSIIFTDDQGNVLKDYNPHEWFIDVSYSLLLSKTFSGAVALRFINSNLTGNQLVNNVESHPGRAVAGDFALFYKKDLNMGEKTGKLALGMHVSNMGIKISYTDDSQQNFLPSNMRLGGSLLTNIDDYNSISVALDINKLLVPTPPIKNLSDSILAGMDDDVSVPTGIFQSFYDAPDGFKEELHEIMYSLGLEYWYIQKFAIRAGYFYEHKTKGNRKFFTTGIGLKLNIINVDFAYLIPQTQHHPLKNTVRFSLSFNLDNMGRKKTSVKQ